MPMREPTHPGTMLAEEFLEPFGVGHSALARQIGYPEKAVEELVRGERRVTAEMALSLSTAFGASAEFWLTLQMEHDQWLSQSVGSQAQ